MAHVRFQVFGGLSASAGTTGILRIPASCHPMLGYLITHRARRISRTELAETLWCDHSGEHARGCLATALWRLKRATRPGPALLSFHGADEVSLNWTGPIWVDAVALELRVRPLLPIKPAALKPADISRLERGARIYRGDFLKGTDAEWAALERRRLRNLYTDGLYQLTAAHAAASNWAGTLEWGRQLNQEEPLREDVHRLLMLAHAQTGNRAKAVAQYRECERVLAAELGVEPMAETQQLHRQLVRSTAGGTVLAPVGAPAVHSAGRKAPSRSVLPFHRERRDPPVESPAPAESPTRLDH
jgi:DNA-binding SARP family transcriptional activator